MQFRVPASSQRHDIQHQPGGRSGKLWRPLSQLTDALERFGPQSGTSGGRQVHHRWNFCLYSTPDIATAIITQVNFFQAKGIFPFVSVNIGGTFQVHHWYYKRSQESGRVCTSRIQKKVKFNS